MSVYLPTPRHKTYYYDFEFQGERYRDSTHQRTLKDAELVEAKTLLALREQAGGLVPITARETPTFSDWAEVTLGYQRKFITRPDILERTLRMVLGFWGDRPRGPVAQAAVARPERVPRPYHNLRLGDPITDPTWLQRFMEWMDARGIGGSSRNSYLSACSDLYTCALQPQYKATTHISENPFAGIRRSPTRGRVVTLTADQILELVGAITRHGRHIAHALCIAALAPKLRVASILALEWDRHFDAGRTRITVEAHKTVGATGLPQVVPVCALLRDILADIQARQQPRQRYVIAYRGGPVQSVKKGLRRAVERIGLAWGLQDGITFHVMRHSIATILADADAVGALTERLRADVMGHKEIRTTQKYTHLNASVQAAPHERLGEALAGLRGAVPQLLYKSVGESVGTPTTRSRKVQQIHAVPDGRVPHSKVG